MPAEYVIDAGNRIVWTKFSGVLTRAEVAEHADKLRADPRFEADFAEVVDLRSAARL